MEPEKNLQAMQFKTSATETFMDLMEIFFKPVLSQD